MGRGFLVVMIGNAEAPADIKVAFAQSARALLVSGRPVGDVGLTACPG